MATNNLTCALSGQCPILDPVVTPTGQICSKKLLLQKLTETNYMNPFTSDANAPLDESQLIEIQGGGSDANVIPPKPSTSNSIPSILNTLSSEYDALVLELYDTRKALEETRKELSVALYQNDAAIRVIARVVLERDLARRQLAEAVAKGGSGSGSADASANKRKREDSEEASASKKINVVEEDNDVQMEDGDESSIPKAHSAQLQEKWAELCKTRKAKTKAGSNYASLDTISKMESTAKKYHKTTNKGISSLSAPVFFSGDDEPVIVSSGTSDKQLIWYNATKHQIQKTVQLKKPILNSQCLSTYGDVSACVTSDYILHVYNGSSEESSTLVLDNEDEIVGVCVHPTCEHVFVSAGSGKVYVVHVEKTNELKTIGTLNGLDGDVKCTCMGLHPDGLILALGRSDGNISVWDLKTEKLASTFEGSSESNPSAQIITIAFSEKGYHVAASTEDGTVAIWDLRKQKNIARIASDDDDNTVFATALSFDPAGKYLAYGSSNSKVVVTAVKEWENKIVIDDRAKEKKGGQVTGLIWGVDAQSIMTSCESDKTVKFWGSS
mmetsp:Transcript_4515/g.5537  ORF Transcript_4515/g.5537 Transcript_4515/m.5537 type:complete len:555 (+) Transcript_4515:68-1732(+)|eukprot:CAMPEP_0203666696 /NCGR_PEP_ID=MMETSP0090-20130426/3688_1 /ASSEMBLY_ACC=CAM_ASM_001088 /TAXON_ID=426623 /ORGANISM="Chaetoceros affinis, Strain CCMP159" /LENGTH=554 /DNA_ID=CAMNT_0050530665 /DNA_START=39 /DNA_END=1703 /DNA_ORIENTATION=-